MMPMFFLLPSITGTDGDMEGIPVALIGGDGGGDSRGVYRA
ncbi:colanic acid biosynthesis glycosyltransferase WcaL [Salmonella enterica subsp. enterica serovar Havana]|nr:colanic acid biosynthesis glycosyltransferase WcaL [Salmonella enterica subsp. enterica serovar Havana]